MLKKFFLKIISYFRKTTNVSKTGSAEFNFLPIELWQECKGDVTKRDEFVGRLIGRKCYAAFLEQRASLSVSVVLLFPPAGEKLKYSVLYYGFDGHNGIGLANQLGRCFKQFRIRKVAVDRFGGSRNLMLAFFRADEIIEVGMGFMSLSVATYFLLGLVSGSMLDHGGDAALSKMVQNLAIAQDPAGNVKPVKALPNGDISGIVALIMAIAAMLADE